MKNFKPPTATRLALALFGAALLLNSSWPLTVAAQDNTPDPAAPKDAAQPSAEDPAAPKDSTQPSSEAPDLAAQIAELRDKVGRLEALLEKSPGSGITSNPTGGMEPTGGKGEAKSSTEAMDDAASKMDGTEASKESAGGMGMMGKGKDMMGNKGMGGDRDEMTEMMKTMRTMMEMKMMQSKGMMGGSTSGMQGKGMGPMAGKGMGMMGKGKDIMGDKGMDMMRQGGSETEMAGSHNPQMKKMMLKMKIKKIELEMIELELQMMEVK